MCSREEIHVLWILRRSLHNAAWLGRADDLQRVAIFILSFCFFFTLANECPTFMRYMHRRISAYMRTLLSIWQVLPFHVDKIRRETKPERTPKRRS